MSKIKIIFHCFGFYKGIVYLCSKFIGIIFRIIFNKTGRKSNLIAKILRKQANKTDDIVKNYIYGTYQDTYNKYLEKKDDTSNVIPNKVIWTCWWQGELNAPEVIKKCIKSMRNNNDGYDVVVITIENIQEYIDIDKKLIYEYEQGVFSAAHFADYLRVKLLNTYGGIWLDATQFLIGNIPESIWDYDLLVWNKVYDLTDKNLYATIPFVEKFNNGFLVGKKGSLFYEFATEITELLLHDEILKIDYFSMFKAYLKAVDIIPELNIEWSKMDEINPYGLITRQFWNKEINDSLKNIIDKSGGFFYLFAYKNKWEKSVNGKQTVQQYILEKFE